MKKRLTAGLLTGCLMAAMLPGFASANDRVEVCHIPKYLPATRTLEVGAAAVLKLLATGKFYLGACDISSPPRWRRLRGTTSATR